MKRTISILNIILVAGVGLCQTLPSSVKHKILQSGEHEYLIEGAYFKDPRTAELLAKFYTKTMPVFTSFNVNTTNNTIDFVTKSTVTNLQEICNYNAREGGMFPYWVELEIRDKRSKEFNQDLYSLAFKTNLVWLEQNRATLLIAATNHPPTINLSFASPTISKDNRTFLVDYKLSYDSGQYKIARTTDKKWVEHKHGDFQKHKWSKPPFYITLPENTKGHVSLNKTTALCRCHSRYAIRIFDDKGGCIWEDQNHIQGFYRLIVSDLDNDGIEEIIVYQYDHGNPSMLILKKHNFNNQVELTQNLLVTLKPTHTGFRVISSSGKTNTVFFSSGGEHVRWSQRRLVVPDEKRETLKKLFVKWDIN